MTKIFRVELRWGGHWAPLPGPPFKTRDDAEWAIAQWRQAQECYQDPFRVVEIPDDPGFPFTITPANPQQGSFEQ